MRNLAVSILLFGCALAAPAQAQVSAAGVFGQGRTHGVFTIGSGYAFDQSYLVLGVGANYYIIDGLNAGLFVERWTGASPHLTKVTPSLQYVFYKVQPVKPYVGVFARRTYIENLPDLNSLGARAGAYLQAGRNVYVGLGAVYESYQSCTATTYRKCDSTYGELSVVFAF
jgi:hypothetical protein